MTLRAKPVVRGPGRSGWNSGDRRTTILNIGFILAISVSVLIFVGYAAWSWYDDHFGAAATVDGTTITKDQLRARLEIETFRITYTEQRIRTLANMGVISAANAQSQIEFLTQRRQSLVSLALSRLIDIEIQDRLADEEGVIVTDADIDEEFRVEATTNEQRHVWVIEVEPEDDADTGEPGADEKAAAEAAAETALAELRAGEAWEDVAKTTSTAASAAQDGDLGWLPLQSGYDEPIMAALFELAQGELTDVVEGEDGVFRIGRVTEILAESVDPSFEFLIGEAGIELATYREAIRADVVRSKLEDKIVADLSAPSLQRHVVQIYLEESTPLPEGVKVRHILYAPKDDPNGASDVPADDPAWAAAEAEATAAYDKLKADPTLFDQLARTESDEGSAKSSGGKLPYFDSASAIDAAFAAAIFAEGLEPGDLIPPFKSAFGWHVVQFMRPYDDGEAAWLKTVRDDAVAGADFNELATDQGEGEEAAEGGDLGWIARSQLSEDLEAPIFETAIGGLSEVVEILGDGVYLFKVLAEEERPASEEQIAIFESSGFSRWYTAKKAEVQIVTNASAATTTIE